jgi:hypothetical protein
MLAQRRNSILILLGIAVVLAAGIYHILSGDMAAFRDAIIRH